MAQDQNSRPSDPREALIAKAIQDKEFRARLLKDPKATVEAELGLVFPEGHELEVIEDTATKTTLVLPMVPDELDLEALESVAGGGWCYGISWYGRGDGKWVVQPIGDTPEKK